MNGGGDIWLEDKANIAIVTMDMLDVFEQRTSYGRRVVLCDEEDVSGWGRPL